MNEPSTPVSTMTAITNQPMVPAQGVPAASASCSACGTAAPSDPPPISWSAGVERGRRSWSCERCTRENLRSIEGKLDTPWW